MGVEFQEDNYGKNMYAPMGGDPVKTGSKFGNWLVKVGLAKDAAGANIVMTILALLVFALSIYFFMFGFSAPSLPSNEPAPPPVPGRTAPPVR